MKRKNLGRPEDPGKLLRAYWHHQADSLDLPRETVEAVLNRAEREGPPHDFHQPVRRGKTRFLVGVVGLATAAVLGVMMAPHGGTIPVQHGSIAGPAASRPSPSGHIRSMAVARGEMWVSLVVHQDAILKVEQPASAIAAKVVAFSNAPSHLQFFTAHDGVWLTRAKSGQWVLYETRDGGVRWTKVALPSSSRHWTDLRAVLSPGRPLTLIATKRHRIDQILLPTARGWRSSPIQGLTGTLSALWLQNGQWGASQGKRLFTSADGGQSWAPSAVEFQRASANPSKSTVLAANPVSSSQLWQQGLATGTAFQGASARWVAISGYLWRQRGPGAAWQKISPLPFSGRAVSVGFTSDLKGYVLSDRGVLWRTEDGGIHWMRFG